MNTTAVFSPFPGELRKQQQGGRVRLAAMQEVRSGFTLVPMETVFLIQEQSKHDQPAGSYCSVE